uniref:Non-classical arabinogalactan protein 31-like n=1 Tax=Nicotiana tabacum TaxID=4097 RepID=A0A1S3X7Y0_TOBAC|nr:PREDICTED: non-classical arabinogalactan protein 31-like [Nicotiana tabacum]
MAAFGVILVLVLSSFTVLGQNEGIVTSELAPHSLVSFPPVETPKPHNGGHHHHRHHNHKHSQAPASSPSHSSPTPSSPPVKPPSPPVKPLTPPAHSPSKPPTPPAHPPVKPPSPLPTRKFVGVRGVVYCKSCKYRGVDTLLGASPIQGAVVKLACNNTKYHLTALGTTDKNGFFFIQPKWLTTAGYHKCKVFLAKSPKPECSVPTNFHNGQAGAMLNPAPLPPPAPMTSKPVDSETGVKLFNVGPFAFEPSKNLPCKQ